MAGVANLLAIISWSIDYFAIYHAVRYNGHVDDFQDNLFLWWLITRLAFFLTFAPSVWLLSVAGNPKIKWVRIQIWASRLVLTLLFILYTGFALFGVRFGQLSIVAIAEGILYPLLSWPFLLLIKRNFSTLGLQQLKFWIYGILIASVVLYSLKGISFLALLYEGYNWLPVPPGSMIPARAPIYLFSENIFAYSGIVSIVLTIVTAHVEFFAWRHLSDLKSHG